MLGFQHEVIRRLRFQQLDNRSAARVVIDAVRNEIAKIRTPLTKIIVYINHWNAGRVLLRLLFTHVLPFAFWTSWLRLRRGRSEDLVITRAHGHEPLTLSLRGSANTQHVDKAIPVFREAIATKKQIALDFSNTRTIDARFLGLILMMKKTLQTAGSDPVFMGLSPGLKRIFRLNGLDFK